MNNQILPEGFRDSLPEVAFKEDKINSNFIKFMQKNGFLLIKPPLMEFESSLSFLNNEEESKSFRVLDPISQKMMGFRSDITIQVARISTNAMNQVPRPLKICYSGEVLRIRNTSLNLTRQSIQVGSEIIGIEKNSCESEIINLIIESLRLFKIKKFFINFSMPTLLNAICRDFNLSKKDFDFVKLKFSNKDTVSLDRVSIRLKEVSDILISSVGSAKKNLKKIQNYKFPKYIQHEIDIFIKIIKKLNKDFPSLELFIDPLDIDESDYHTGVSFKVFSKSLKELFSGGNYCVVEENCIGFSGFIESLLNESSIGGDLKKKILIPKNLAFQKINNLQKKGYVTFQAIKSLSKKQFINHAKKQKCSFYFFDNTIYKTK